MNVGILGGGQLAQMMAQAGSRLGMSFMFLCPDPQACAAPFGQHLCAPFADTDAKKQLAEWADVATYEFENIPAEDVASLEQQIVLHPSSKALAVARDRLIEKRCFRSLGIPTAEFMPIESLDDLKAAIEVVGLPAILKTRTMGYDGKGQAVLRSPDDLPDAWKLVGEVPCIVESMVNFTQELSIIAARSTTGELAFYPLSENHHREGILRLSISREDHPQQAIAQSLIQRLLDELDYVGVLALELFQVGDEFYANEMAPRVHNTGHWTIDGAVTSQFENHLRAICGMPLGATDAPAHAAMVNLIGLLQDEETIRKTPGAIPHFYGKSERPGRKVGHINLVDNGDGLEAFNQRLAGLLQLAGEDALAEMLRPTK